MNIDKRIVEFITEHHVLTLATTSGEQAYCANCFYTYMNEENCFAFSTDLSTRHAQEAKANPKVAGSIVLETMIVGKIQGIQFTGKMFIPEGELAKTAEKAYLKRFPFAKIMETTIWVLEPEYIKMTHNVLGFGKKLVWEKE